MTNSSNHFTHKRIIDIFAKAVRSMIGLNAVRIADQLFNPNSSNTADDRAENCERMWLVLDSAPLEEHTR